MLLTLIRASLCTSLCTKHFTWIIAFNSSNNPFWRWAGGWGEVIFLPHGHTQAELSTRQLITPLYPYMWFASSAPFPSFYKRHSLSTSCFWQSLAHGQDLALVSSHWHLPYDSAHTLSPTAPPSNVPRCFALCQSPALRLKRDTNNNLRRTRRFCGARHGEGDRMGTSGPKPMRLQRPSRPLGHGNKPPHAEGTKPPQW